MKITAVFFFLLLFTCESYSQYPSINEARPRIVFSGARFNWLAAHYTSGACGQSYTSFRYGYDHNWIPVLYTYLVGTDSTQWNYVFRAYTESESGYRRDIVWTAIYTAFLWKVTGDPVMLKRVRFISYKLLDAIDTLNFNNFASNNREIIERDYSQISGTFLDWCYNDLPLQLRTELAIGLYKINRDFMNYFITSANGNSYVSSHNAYNSVLTLQNVFALYHADGISLAQNDTIQTWYHVLYDKWMNNFFPVYAYYRGNSGGWNWGAAYSFWSLVDNYTVFDNILIATNTSLYQQLPWVYNTVNQYWYMLRPNYRVIHLGDGETFVTCCWAMYRHAAIFQDHRSRWLTQLYSTYPFITGTNSYYDLLGWRDFEAATVSQPQIPLDWLSDKVGLMTSRTSWDTTSVQLWFFNSPSKRTSHEHRDNNTFEIFYRKPLIVDAGYYDSYGTSHFMNYYTRTVAHNVVCVFDPNEQFYYGTTPVSNDGGQKYSDPLMNYGDIFSPAFQRGRWLAYSSGNGYCYSAADASLSYSSKVTRYTRRILFLKPNRVVVLDNVALNPLVINLQARWTAHFQQMPQPSGALIETTVPGHIETFNGNDCYAANGQGNVSIRTLLPESSKVKRIGGAGYEYWVNGVNYPPLSIPDTITYTPGRWRIEVSPCIADDSVAMLHNISIGDNVQPSAPGGIALKSLYSVGTDWNNSIVLFNSKGDTGVSVQKAIDINGNRTITYWTADLKRNRNYKIFLNNNFMQGLNADSSGIITGTMVLPSGSNHMIDIILDSLVSVKPIGNELPTEYNLYQNYPNPFNPSTKIKFDVGPPLSSPPYEGGDRGVVLTIYDILGKEIATLVNRQLNPGTYEVEWNASNYPSGVYFYHLSSKYYNHTKKLVFIK